MPFVVRRADSLREPFANADTSPSSADALRPSAYFAWALPASRFAALLLVIPAFPLIVLLMMLVQMTSYGPALYRQRRVGLHGKIFTLYKIRTMLHNAEAQTGPVWTAPNDPRITKLGKFLRAVHLDELPQLLNVLRGEMTLIGPRPERPEFTQRLARQIPGYMTRFSVVPGITGLAQVNLPADTDLDSVRRKLMLDREYIRSGRLRSDAAIFLATLVKLFGLPSWRVVRWLGLERSPDRALEEALALAERYDRRAAGIGGQAGPSIYRETDLPDAAIPASRQEPATESAASLDNQPESA